MGAGNFYDVDTLKRLLKTASWVHLSQFHWHVVDSHAWPLHVPACLRFASACASHFFSTADTDIQHLPSSQTPKHLARVELPGRTLAADPDLDLTRSS